MRGRKPNRLKGFDYSTPGFYFITIIVKNRIPCLCHINNGIVELTDAGRIVRDCWYDLTNHYHHIRLDSFVIMPNHVHGIIEISENDAAVTETAQQHGLPEIVRGLKTFSSRRIHETGANEQFQWHKSYHDRIVRNAAELDRIRLYVENNPNRWTDDPYV